MLKTFKELDQNPQFLSGLGLVFFFFLIYLKYPYLAFPLLDDEFYYAKPGVFDYFSAWTDICFGHPPGWNLLNGIIFSIFGYSPFVAHWTALLASSLSLVAILIILGRSYPVSLSFFIVSLIASHRYFLESFSHSHPVILSAHMGFLALLVLKEKKYKTFAALVTCSVLLRESGLVFAVAGFLMERNIKILKYSLFPIVSFLIVHIWYFLAQGKVMINGYVEAMAKTTSTFTFDLQHMMGFYEHFIFDQVHISTITILLLLPFFFEKFKHNPFAWGLLVIFLLHSLFFSLYTHQAIRSSYFSGSAIALLGLIPLYSFRKNLMKKSWFPLILLPYIAYIWHSNLSLLNDSGMELNNYGRVLPAIREFVSDMDTLRRKHPEGNIKIMTVYPIDKSLQFPHVGFVERPYHHILSAWAGEKTRLPDPPPDVIAITIDFGDRPRSKLLRKLAEQHSWKPVKNYHNALEVYLSPGSSLSIPD